MIVLTVFHEQLSPAVTHSNENNRKKVTLTMKLYHIRQIENELMGWGGWKSNGKQQSRFCFVSFCCILYCNCMHRPRDQADWEMRRDATTNIVLRTNVRHFVFKHTWSSYEMLLLLVQYQYWWWLLMMIGSPSVRPCTVQYFVSAPWWVINNTRFGIF